MTEKSPIVVITGPTAVGKTAVAVELAPRLGSEIISADSRQVYRGLDIGTGKPTSDERKKAPHHLIDVVDPDQRFSAAQFAREAVVVVNTLEKKGEVPLVVGGTGLYLRALQKGLFPSPPRDDKLRDHLKKRADRDGTESLHRELAAVDPEAAARIHPRDQVRIIRALEVWKTTGRPISDLQRNHTRSPLPGRSWIRFLLTRDWEDLEDRITGRVNEMVAAGWLDEIRRLIAAGYSFQCPAMESLGYRTMGEVVEGKKTIEEAIDKVVRETRQYAKRQLTWFGGENDLILVPMSGRLPGEILSDLVTAMDRQKA